MSIYETTIDTAGVFRCCLNTVAREYQRKQVHIGDKSKCKYCHMTFTLTKAEPKPMWVPDWKLTTESLKSGV